MTTALSWLAEYCRVPEAERVLPQLLARTDLMAAERERAEAFAAQSAETAAETAAEPAETGAETGAQPAPIL